MEGFDELLAWCAGAERGYVDAGSFQLVQEPLAAGCLQSPPSVLPGGVVVAQQERLRREGLDLELVRDLPVGFGDKYQALGSSPPAATI